VNVHLGRAQLELQTLEINHLLARLEGTRVSFQHGCFTVHSKLPMGLGVTFVAIPRSRGETLLFVIPLDQIRGDRTGGMAKFLAGGIWGLLQSHLEKTLRKRLLEQGLPLETLSLTHGVEGKSKVALLTVHLPLLNAWLMKPGPQQPLGVALAGAQFGSDSLTLVVDLYGDRQARSMGPAKSLL